MRSQKNPLLLKLINKFRQLLTNVRNFKVKTKITKFLDKLGTQTGWSIDADVAESLYQNNQDFFIKELGFHLSVMEDLFNMISTLLSVRCENKSICVESGVTEFNLLRCDTGCRIQITEYDEIYKLIYSFTLFYRGVLWCHNHKEDSVLFNDGLFSDLDQKLQKFKTMTREERLSFIRRVNWLACTLNDINERVEKGEIELIQK